ncbi:MAG TPA: hypothetical protein VN886_20585, partial [Acidimicrobiales bacterium]|nr:hypothetical protein [Acidimicrobiales bacterium]
MLLELHLHAPADVDFLGQAVHHVGREPQSLLLHQINDRDAASTSTRHSLRPPHLTALSEFWQP